MLMEELFSSGIMKMGPSRIDPDRQVGVFNPDFISGLPAQRAAEMERLRWLVGEWNYENPVPATSVSHAYTDIGSCTYSLNEKSNWLCLLTPDGREIQQITFDPFSKQWIYVLLQGSYGILRSPGWVGDQIAFSGLMTMIGLNREWRITWTKASVDQFSFVNEEQNTDGSWSYIDEWRFNRKN
jgi:hypothetical protein